MPRCAKTRCAQRSAERNTADDHGDEALTNGSQEKVMSATATVERDGSARWVEPFAGMYWRIRAMTYLLALALVVILTEGYWLFRLSSEAAAHVYEVSAEGETTYVGLRYANLAPRPAEIRRVAQRFVRHLLEWHSVRVESDMASAINLCSAAVAERLKEEVLTAQVITTIASRQIRSEMRFSAVEITENTDRYAKISVVGEVSIYPMAQLHGEPEQVRPFWVIVTLDRVPRDPNDRPEGLEVGSLEIKE
jgi:hypothetical protein